MIAFIALCYGSLYLLLFNKLGLLKKTAANISAFAGVGVVMVGAIVFLWYTFSPMSSDARVFRYIIPIVPNVKGQIVSVPVQANKPLSAGDVLFRIDPEPYEYAVRRLQAQVRRHEAELRLAEVNVERAAKLVRTQAGAQIDLDIWTANRDAAQAAIDAAMAQLDNASWELDETQVTAPEDGYVVNLQLRPGNFVTSVPMASSLAFVSTQESLVLASFSQSAVRRISAGNTVDMVFTSVPGKTFSGVVTRVVRLGSQSQLQASGQLPTLTGAPVTDRWAVLAELDNADAARNLAQGAGGTMAVYTDAGAAFHIISKVAVRMQAWLGYLTTP